MQKNKMDKFSLQKNLKTGETKKQKDFIWNIQSIENNCFRKFGGQLSQEKNNLS